MGILGILVGLSECPKFCQIVNDGREKRAALSGCGPFLFGMWEAFFASLNR